MAGRLLRGGMILLAGAAFGASPAMAQDGKVIIDETGYVVPAPEGYCAGNKVVDGFIEHERAVHSPFTPDLVMLACDAKVFSSDLFMISVRKNEPKTTREAMLDELRRTLPDGPAAPQTREALGKRLNDTLAASAMAGSDFKPVGVDDTCGYIAGIMPSMGESSDSTTVIGCMTVVGGTQVFYLRYLPGKDIAKAQAAMLQLRSLVVATHPEQQN